MNCKINMKPSKSEGLIKRNPNMNKIIIMIILAILLIEIVNTRNIIIK